MKEVSKELFITSFCETRLVRVYSWQNFVVGEIIEKATYLHW